MRTTESEEKADSARAARGPDAALAALVFLSGALGLHYEVVWFRRLQLTLGVSLFAVGAVLAAFMLGLAVGSHWAPRSAWLRRAPLAAYAAIELGIAAYAVAFPLLIGALEALYPTLFRWLDGHTLALFAARFVLAFLILLPPALLMGASLPAVAEAVAAPRERLAASVARLYALNTLGGVAGTLLSGFFLIEHLGIRGSLYAGAAGSTLVAAAAFILARRSSGNARVDILPPEKDVPATVVTTENLARLATTAALVSGAVALASQIVWTRALVFFVHNSTYAFSAIVAVFLLGVAAGALFAARFSRTPTRAARLLAATLALGALALVGAIAVYRHLPELAAALAAGAPVARRAGRGGDGLSRSGAGSGRS